MKGRGLAVDLPTSWLVATWWGDLTLSERAIYVSALMWTMGQQLDGRVPRNALRFLDEDVALAAKALDRFALTGRVETTEEGWLFVDWEGLQMQNSAESIQRSRQTSRERQARHRRAAASRSTETANVTRDSGRDVPRDKSGDVGEVTVGQGQEVDWVVAQIPKSLAGEEPF